MSFLYYLNEKMKYLRILEMCVCLTVVNKREAVSSNVFLSLVKLRSPNGGGNPRLFGARITSEAV